MGDYATKGELSDLKREMYEGFEKINDAVDNLVKNTNQSFKDLATNITTVIGKSKDGDSSVRNELMREIETKEKERRSSNIRTTAMVVSLLTMIWGAVWWGININDDKKRSDDKLEVCRKMHEIEIQNKDYHHKMELRIQELELTK